MATQETSSNKFDAYLAQIESRERSKRRRYQISAVLGVLLLIGGFSFWLYTPTKDAELRHYEASSLNYSMVKNLFDDQGGEIVVAHPMIGEDTIYSAEDYLSLKGLLDELEMNSTNQSGETTIDVPPTYAVDIAGTREAGSSLIFSIENYDESLTYMIDFGNGYRRELENSITYSYRRPGNFRLRLIATNEQGSSSIYNKSIRINSVPGTTTAPETVIAQAEPLQEATIGSDSIEQPSESQQQPDLVAMRGAQMRTPETISPESPNARAAAPVIEEETAPVPSSMDPLVMAEIAPQFPGGLNAMGSFIKSNYRYPRDAQRANIEGKVFVQFVVNSDGSISNERVIRGIGGGCDEEAMRLVQMMPKWVPGRQDGQIVAAYHTIPITFKLLR